MSSPRITFTYSVREDDLTPRLILEQEPVPGGKLSVADLANMLALVRSGISAYTYIVQECPATVVAGKVIVPLTLYVWPSVPDLHYDLSAAIGGWTNIGPAIALEQERDFDLIIPETDEVDLPCLAAGVELNWQTPAITSTGGVVDPPAIIGFDPGRNSWLPISSSGEINRIRLAREVFGVLRVKCRAIGYRHNLTMTIPKTGDQKLTDIEETITASWQVSDDVVETDTLDLALPGCVAALLAACEDGLTPGGRTEILEPDELIPELRYSTCTGLPIGNVQYIKAVER